MNSPDVWTIFKQLRRRDPPSLTRGERLVLVFGEIRTEVNHGGFDFYLRYPYGRNAPAAVEAARIAGCPALADLIEEAIALVGHEVLQANDQDRLSQRLEQIEDELTRLDQRFYELENTADLDAAQSRLVARLA
jgi:uncharacterized protein DUF4375